MFNAASFTPAVLDRILALLATLFLPSTAGNLEAARSAAAALLASYDVRTGRQLRLAALAIAFSFGALDSLSRAAAPELPANQVLRLRGNANALNRAAQQNEAKLEKLIGQPEAAPEAAVFDEPLDLPASSEPPDLLAFLHTASATPVLSRQQRRLAERQAEKQREREQKAARLEERVARRLAEKEAARLAATPVPLHQPEAAFARTASIA
ncbi:MAG: hypothetical protein ACJ8AW_21490 [Rhodopila sp.]